ncbi:MAG: GIY-YIG nuclease family protein [Flavobacteriales bacterium]
MKFYYVYILKCSDKSYYSGFTNNLELRFNQHQAGINPESYTHSRRPVELVYCIKFDNPNDGIAFEKKIKGWSRKKKEALINGDWDRLKFLAICKNDSHYSNNMSKERDFDSA